MIEWYQSLDGLTQFLFTVDLWVCSCGIIFLFIWLFDKIRGNK